MALGVAPMRRCPDQVASESARKAYVDQALAVPETKPKQPTQQQRENAWMKLARDMGYDNKFSSRSGGGMR